MRNLNYLDGSYSIADIEDFEYILKKHGEKTDNHLVKKYVNKIELRIIFKIKTRYLELLTPETMKLLGTTKSEITKDENGENKPHLEITESVSVHRNIVNNDCQQDSWVLCNLFLINHLINNYILHQRTLYF